MRHILVTATIATLILMLDAGSGFAQPYPLNPYGYNPGNAGIMGIGPGGRAAYQPQYYSTAPYYGNGMYGGYGFGSANMSPNITGLPSQPEAVPDEAYLQSYRSRYFNAALIRPNAAAIDVRVPAGSQLWFQDRQTRQKGGVRLFESPPLEPGKTYAYKVKAEWTNEDGEKVERTRTIQVRAGQHVALDLRRRE